MKELINLLILKRVQFEYFPSSGVNVSGKVFEILKKEYSLFFEYYDVFQFRDGTYFISSTTKE
jgi:hypothetical protein